MGGHCLSITFGRLLCGVRRGSYSWQKGVYNGNQTRRARSLKVQNLDKKAGDIIHSNILIDMGLSVILSLPIGSRALTRDACIQALSPFWEVTSP